MTKPARDNTPVEIRIPIDRATWERMWGTLSDAGKTMRLIDYVAFCARTKQTWREQFGAWRYDNGRYVVHVEEQLARGLPFKGDVTLDDMRYDAPSLPLVCAAIARATGKDAL